MQCPKCSADTKVYDTRARNNEIWRRRKCLACSHRFTTWEVNASSSRHVDNVLKVLRAISEEPTLVANLLDENA